MTPKEIHADLARTFGGAIGELVETASPFVWVERNAIRDVALHLRDRLGFDSLSCLSGVHTKGMKAGTEPSPDGKKAAPPPPEEFWVVYHLSSVKTRDKIALKVRLPLDDPRLPSVASVWGVADWHEREAYDLFGIVFEGHPNLRRILLPDDWVGHPLRKDYEEPRYYRHIPHARQPSAAALLDDPSLLEALEAEAPAAKKAEKAAPSGPPWHDPTLSLAERMALAADKGLYEKLFAAMAQTDCTACGYDCAGYAKAIYEGADTDISKCRPGAEETLEMLKKLMEEAKRPYTVGSGA